ncbi:MAG TPA: ferritin [Candidatus Paceibacterota bacterium]|nr:ferritin [Verrucomicrobiota bacterium]HSA10457.1 ferritin [Candidatus Paceibacterota bacterium]
MKLSSKLEKVLNDQINLEFSSAYAYLGMAAYFERTPFTGFGKWMRVQSKEELDHANRFFKYVVERGGKVGLQSIAEPKCDYRSPLDAFKASLGHEQKVSAAIYAIYELAAAEKDYATLSFLKWFLDEQVEEERNVSDLLTKLELAGDHRGALYQIDREAGRRAEEDKD